MRSDKEILDETGLCDVLCYTDWPDVFVMELPGTDEIIDEYYRDQAPNQTQFEDRYISSILLTTGIKRIDNWFQREICDPDSKHTKKELEHLIRVNPHLHNVIKTNLLDNLHNIKKQ